MCTLGCACALAGPVPARAEPARTLRLVSTGGANLDASLQGLSSDGRRAFFITGEAIPGTNDSDTAQDVYERHADGTLRLISTSGANTPASFAGASSDGSRVFFSTLEAIP